MSAEHQGHSAVQVAKAHYYTLDYNHKSRWLSYFYQIKLIRKSGASSVLEIGPGNGWVTHVLRSVGLRVATADIDPALKPDYVADIRALPFKDGEFDAVCAFEVLEHLPFETFGGNLRELSRVAKKHVLISLPDKRKTLLNLSVKIPFVNHFSFCIKVPTFTEHHFDGQHYWEIGKKGYSPDRVRKEIQNAGLILERDFVMPDLPTIHFFVISKPS